ncbi:hypothetical protein [Herbidospora cretacea]|uniref:hypothetical protein n=1 Tax=Herbidospora cretacea TaxID=28444 RepID=UPI0007731B68|nr:hypothetical protein [Herbidospora cretacea]
MRTLRPDTATRHLCAGVYLDRNFRTQVLHQVHNDTRHMIAPSYGFDLVPVVRHAWRAWRLEHVQHTAVLLIVVTGWAVNPPALIGAGCAIGMVAFARLALVNGGALVREQAKARADEFLHRVRWRSETDALREHKRLIRVGLTGLIVLMLLPFVVSALHGTPAGHMLRLAALLTLLLATVVVIRATSVRIYLGALQSADRLDGRMSARLADIARQEKHPVVVYTRAAPPSKKQSRRGRTTPSLEEEEKPEPLLEQGVSPFVGAGFLVHRWLPPVVIQLKDKVTKLDLDSPRFEPHELVGELRRSIVLVGDPRGSEALPGFRVADRLFVAEEDITEPRPWLSQAPDPTEIDDVIDRPYGLRHHFLEITTSATGEVVTTVFLRVTVKGGTLSIDFAACALTRTPTELHLSDRHGAMRPGEVVRTVLLALADLPREIASVVRLGSGIKTATGALRAIRHARDGRPATTGPRLSVRENRSTPWKRAELDKVLVLDHMKVIELHLFKTIEVFLDDRKIDIEDLTERAASIINAGVLNMGGRVEINDSAVGPNSQYRNDVRDDGRPGEGAHE